VLSFSADTSLPILTSATESRPFVARAMVWQVLEMVANGMAWETIVEEWGGSITKEAIAEAVQLASKSFVEHATEHALERSPA